MLQGHETLMLKNEVYGLRELVRNIRGMFEKAGCDCESGLVIHGDLCGRCIVMGVIDNGLATIKEHKNG